MTSKTFATAGGGFSRRQMLQGTAGVGLAALTGPGAQAQPKRGGTLRVAMGHGNTADGYDPGTWDNAYAQVFAAARNCQLTEITANGKLVGEIAESWESSPDAKTWTIKIRKGVEFHSGKPLTPDDVVASLNYHRGPESKSAAKPIVAAVADIRADGQNVVVELNASNSGFAWFLSDYHLAILPGADGKIDPTSSDGCGGYVVKSYQPGVRAQVERFAHYWKPDRAHFEAIELRPVLDAAARTNALITGQVDVIDPVELSTAALLKRSPRVKIIDIAGNQQFCFPMDTRTAPFKDNNVRMALKHAIDRQEIVDKVLNGYGVVGNDHPIGRSSPDYDPALAQKTYDPDKARYFLKQAGLDTLEVSLSASDAAFAGAVNAAVLYAERAAKAGIKINVVREPSDGYWANVWMKKPFVASYWGGRPLADWMYATAYSDGAPWNESFWSNDKFNKMLLAARSEVDETKRHAMYADMQAIVANEGGTIIPVFANYVTGLSDKVKHPESVAANWTLDGLRAVERWWFA